MSQTNDITEGVEIETLCMKCYKNGVTRFLLTPIPRFRDILVSSFECPHCGHTNREVQSGLSLAASGGCRYVLKVNETKDLDRQIIKGCHASLSLPDIELEIPSCTQKGACTTLEGILQETANGLQKALENHEQSSAREGINKVLQKVICFSSREFFPFTVILEDPAGQSYIESYSSDVCKTDDNLELTHFQPSKEQLNAMGFYETQETKQGTCSKSLDTLPRPANQTTQLDMEHLPKQIQMEGWDLTKSVEENIQKFSRSGTAENREDANDTEMAVHFSVDCPHCGQQGHNDMCEINIPGFRKCIIMAFVCDFCGSRSNEVKPTGAYSDKGRKWTLYVNSQEDLNRDILKSHTASISLPSIDFEMLMGSLGGVFTTLEGLLLKIRDSLTQQCAMFLGDSANIDRKKAYDKLMDQLLKFATEPNLYPFTFIMDDAADFSMIGPKGSSHALPSSTVLEGAYKDILHNDENLKFEYYERSQEQNNDLGISHMVVENYEEPLKEESENVV